MKELNVTNNAKINGGLVIFPSIFLVKSICKYFGLHENRGTSSGEVGGGTGGGGAGGW
ncbi:hypothetical protein GGR28_001088 [Lewinella aquimaris]|uniref:Uncharacterized protein n=1 Tax=Neolewinella aquimaris TaxID=1835722 RepID=A0A840E484_9BACT|nr:hypothetical protein [Neolewinella aquimaris]MBB4078475.1 hypothetical protein [Neolewinella aquimaris]